MKQEQQQVFSGRIIGIGYNTIAIKRDDNGRGEVIHFDGLQKRLLNGVNEDFLKKLKRIEWIGEDFEIGINLFVCCDDCNNALFPLNSDDDRFLLDEKVTCGNCGKWLCSDCAKSGFCRKCFKGEILDRLN